LPGVILHQLDPSAAPPTRFWLAAVKSSWRASTSQRTLEIRLALAPTFSGGSGGASQRHSVNTQTNAN